jgi:hypothetical protein
VATNAIFRRSFFSPRIRWKYDRIVAERYTPCQAASTRYFLAVAGPCLVMCPSRLLEALESWQGISPKYTATWPAFSNRFGSSIYAAAASAVRAPTPEWPDTPEGGLLHRLTILISAVGRHRVTATASGSLPDRDTEAPAAVPPNPFFRENPGPRFNSSFRRQGTSFAESDPQPQGFSAAWISPSGSAGGSVGGKRGSGRASARSPRVSAWVDSLPSSIVDRGAWRSTEFAPTPW